MNLDPVSDLAASMADMSQMLLKLNDAKLALDDKMLHVAAEEAAQSITAGSVNVTA
jgi:hypothetical protein